MSIYDFQAALIDGTSVELSAYQGKVVLIVNTASQCGFARQFTELQQLYEAHADKGFEILAFPCNQFNDKEPGINAEIETYCRTNYGITFPLFEKVDVRGSGIHPLFDYLTRQAPFQGYDTQTEGGQWMSSFLQNNYPDRYADNGVNWNYTKFLVNRNGEVQARFEPTIKPKELISDIELLL